MKFFLFLLTGACLFNIAQPAYGQLTPHFTINVLTTSDTKKAADFAPASSALYEDDTYVVSAYCYGEFGGGLFFKNKHTDSTYTCQATCALNVIKLQNRYVVSCALAHMMGFAQVFEIADPRQMKAVPAARRKSGKHPKIVVAQGELSTAGTKTLADSLGVLLSGSFPLNGRPYFIVTDFKNTYLATIENSRFSTVAKLADFSTWSYDPAAHKTTDDHYLFFYKNDKAQGYIDVHNTTVNVFRYP
jgi:hypothetical protein